MDSAALYVEAATAQSVRAAKPGRCLTNGVSLDVMAAVLGLV
ncbi:hypothetical protein ACLECX_00540 [Lonsdalea quercina]|nr:hypothetical protein [Lonsdalea quercina]